MAEKYYSISPYAYVANNPLKYIDPTGTDTIHFEFNTGSIINVDQGTNDLIMMTNLPTVIVTSNIIVENRDDTETDNMSLSPIVISLPEIIDGGKFALNLALKRYFPAYSLFLLLEEARLESIQNNPINVGKRFSTFSKTARGNHRDDGLAGWTDDEINQQLDGLKGSLSKDEKALKKKLAKEQKVRGQRNTQKKSGEKNVGTGRRQ